MKIVALDLGSKSVKAVEVDTVFGRFEIQDHHERLVDTTTGQTPESVAADLLESFPKRPDKIVYAAPTRLTTFRNLNLPTRDRKAIQSSIRFELEDDLPFDTDATHFDSVTLGQSKSGTRVHIAATLKQNLAPLLERMKSSNIEPDVLTTEAWAMRALGNRVLSVVEQESPTLFVHVGHDRTLLYIHFQQAPLIIREISWGGRELTLALCKALGLTVEAAEKALIEKGVFLSDEEMSQKPATHPQDVVAISRALSSTLGILVSELRQTILAAKGITQVGTAQILTSGLPSLIPGLWREVSDALGIPTRPLLALSSTALSGVTYSETTDATFTVALATALAVVGPDKSLLINLRKGEFAKKVASGKSMDLSALRNPMIVGAVTTGVLFATLLVESFVYNSQMDDLNVQLERSVKSFFGQISASAVRQYMNSTSSLKTAMQKEIKKQRDIAKLLAPNPRSPLDHLNELSGDVSKDLSVDLMQYQIGAAPTKGAILHSEEPVSLTFWAKDAATAEKVATLASAKLKEASTSKVEQAAAPDGAKKYRVTVTGKAGPDAFGGGRGN